MFTADKVNLAIENDRTRTFGATFSGAPYCKCQQSQHGGVPSALFAADNVKLAIEAIKLDKAARDLCRMG